MEKLMKACKDNWWWNTELCAYCNS